MAELKDRGEEIHKKLVDLGLFKEPGRYESRLEDGRITFGEGYPITAVEKFLGYFDKQMNIANFPSISFNTDFSKAVTACEYISEPGNDLVVLDGEQSQKYQDRAGKAVNYFKGVFGIKGSFRFYIKREKRYNEAKGLGESAAIASSTSRAVVSNVYGDKAVQDGPFVSRLARLVSGSGTRSSMNGFSLWLSYPWIREDQSLGVKLPVDYSRFHFMSYPSEHEIRTESAHDVAFSSPFYPRWLINKFQKILDLIDGGLTVDEIMKHAEEDMYLMHSLLVSKGIFIHTPASLDLINRLKKFKERNEGIYYTADTGPSLVVMSGDRKLLEEFSATTEEEPIWGKVMDSFSLKPDSDFMKEAEEYLTGQ